MRQVWWDTGEVPADYRVFREEAGRQIPHWPGFRRLGRFEHFRDVCEEAPQ